MHRTRGFTLIELLVVIAVIGILAGVVLSSLNEARAKARDAKRIEDLRQINIALQLYYEQNGVYPPSSCGYDCNGYSVSSSVNWATLQTALAPYLSTLPVDPKNTGSRPWVAGEYVYSYGNVGRTTHKAQYDLTAQLESAHPLRCAVQHYRFYFDDSVQWCGSYTGQLYEASPKF